VSSWYKNRWQIVFDTNKYSLVSDNNNTYAKDPIDQTTDLKDIELVGLSITLSGGCSGHTIVSFDSLGRPIVGNLSDDTSPHMKNQLLTTKCIITLSDGSESSKILILQETGFVSATYK